MMKNDIRIRQSKSALGNSHMFLLTLDPKETWAHGIMENSRYARFHYDPSTGKIELFASNKLENKFRKRKCDSVDTAKRIIYDFAGKECSIS